MKNKDLMRFIDAIAPSDALQARILALPKRHSRPKLENPLKLAAAFGITGLICAGAVAAVLVLQNGATPSPTIDAAQSEAPGLVPSTPKLSLGQGFGADMVFLDYASDDIVIFHGYFGLFVYDLDSKKVIRSLDLAPIGCAATQGDNYCAVSVSADGNTVQLHPLSSKNAYIYTVSDNTLRETVFESMESRFTGLVDPETDAGFQRVYQKNELCSYRAVRFGTGEYGYLRALEWVVDTLTYVRGDTVYELFKDLPAPASNNPVPTPMPTPAPQDSGLGSKITLPEGILSADDIIAKARQAFKDALGINADNCVVIDYFSYRGPVVYGTADYFVPRDCNNEFAGKKLMMLSLQNDGSDGLQWHIEFRSDGTYGKHYYESATLIINAESGEIKSGPAQSSDLVKMTLPEVNISPDEAISIARKVCK
jgi:hypothetical protein